MLFGIERNLNKEEPEKEYFKILGTFEEMEEFVNALPTVFIEGDKAIVHDWRWLSDFRNSFKRELKRHQELRKEKKR